MNEQRETAMDELSLWMQETICRWLPGANVWHLEEITLPVRALLRRPALGVWYALADISAQHTQAIITSFFGDDHLELNAVFTFPRVPRTSEYTGLCFAWLLADLLLRAGVLAPPEALKAAAVCGDARWDGLAALHTEPSPQREAARVTVRAVTWWWILCRK
jgi:hypothetical protein